MAAGKRPALPLVLSASELLDGDVVYFTDKGWDVDLSAALVARDEAAAERLEAALAEVATGGPVVEPYLLTVVPGLGADGAPIIPGHYRERIRALGPTFRNDLGPQARQEQQNVSL